MSVCLKHVIYRSSVPGNTLVITGGVHGDETCGPKALQALISALDHNVIRIAQGTLIIVPVCNPRAYAEHARFIDRNLNRYLFPKKEKQHYEDHIDPLLCAVLEQADYLLDLHSYHSEGGPFIFVGNDDAGEVAFARDLGIRDFVSGWGEAYGSGGTDESTGTTEYARRFNAKACTLECGRHDNENAAEIGYAAALRAMRHSGILAEDIVIDTGIPHAQQRLVKMRDVCYAPENGRLSQPYIHFDDIEKGDIIAVDAGGESLYTAPEKGCIILPRIQCDAGSEWFYFGERVDF